MVEYGKVNDKLSDTQLKTENCCQKKKTETTLRMILQMFDGNNLPHEYLLTTRQRKKLRNAFNNNLSTDIKLSKGQMSEMTQLGGFLGPLLSRLASLLMKVAIPLAKIFFSSIRNYSSCFSKCCRNSKENT